MPDTVERQFRVLKQQLIAIANHNNLALDDAEDILQLIIENELVFALWADAGEPDGVGVILVKGLERLDRAAAAVSADLYRISAISCTSRVRVEELAETIAGPKVRH